MNGSANVVDSAPTSTRTDKPLVVVVGGSFAGLTSAYTLKRELGDRVDVTVVARQKDFVFIPSLIWVAPGKRTGKQVSFELEPRLAMKDISFMEAIVETIDPVARRVTTDHGSLNYDYLVLATGPKLEWTAIEGLGPKDGYTHSVCSLPDAVEANEAWEKFLKDPGPVVVGAAQGASCFGAAVPRPLRPRRSWHG